MSENDRELVYTRVEVEGGDAWDYQDLTQELQAFLREAGTPEELRIREARMLFEFSEILKSVPEGELSEEQRFFVKETMTIMRNHLTRLRAQAEWAVAMLAREGFRYDADTRRFERLEGFTKMRRHRFADDVVEAYEALAAEGSGHGDGNGNGNGTGNGNGSGSGDGTATASGNTRAARVKIAECLKGDYPELMLSPRSYFPIWHCLAEYLAGKASR